MPRARNIKPSFFANDNLAELSCEARLLFIGLWTLADREGRLEDRPLKIKGQIFPYENHDVIKLLEDLCNARFITRYVVNGCKCIHINTFRKHQNPHPNEKESELPPPPSTEAVKCNEDSISRHVNATDDFVKCNKAIGLNPDSLLLNPDTGILKPDVPAIAEKSKDDSPELSKPALDRFEQFWKNYPARNGRKEGKQLALKQFAKLTVEHQENAIEAAENYRLEQDPQFVKDAFRFLRDKIFLDWLNAKGSEYLVPEGFSYIKYLQEHGGK